MMHLRGSLGSERSLPEPRPSDSFHLRRDSSFWSGVMLATVIVTIVDVLLQAVKVAEQGGMV